MKGLFCDLIPPGAPTSSEHFVRGVAVVEEYGCAPTASIDPSAPAAYIPLRNATGL